MWVVYQWVPHEGNFGHKYFKSEQKAETYLVDAVLKDHWSNWEIEEIIFEDED